MKNSMENSELETLTHTTMVFESEVTQIASNLTESINLPTYFILFMKLSSEILLDIFFKHSYTNRRQQTRVLI